MKLTAVQKNDIVKRVRSCRYQTQAEALHAAVQLAEEALAVAQPAGDPVAWPSGIDIADEIDDLLPSSMGYSTRAAVEQWWRDLVSRKLSKITGQTSSARAPCDGGTCGLGGYCDDCPAVIERNKQQPVEPFCMALLNKQGDITRAMRRPDRWMLTDKSAVKLYTAPPAAAQPADRMSSVAKRKAADLMASGYEVAGYVLVRDGDRSAVLWDAAVRWITPADRHRLMHVEGSLIDPPAAARVPLTVAQMVDVVEPLCVDREVAEALVKTSMDEYRAIEQAHGITGGAA